MNFLIVLCRTSRDTGGTMKIVRLALLISLTLIVFSACDTVKRGSVVPGMTPAQVNWIHGEPVSVRKYAGGRAVYTYRAKDRKLVRYTFENGRIPRPTASASRSEPFEGEEPEPESSEPSAEAVPVE
ncbi:MAG: hypothetical protein HKN23_21800 [Verrucomicrobiales bacterium]|nr:hypothetical protein [Verrucomicrobiales bacterium]